MLEATVVHLDPFYMVLNLDYNLNLDQANFCVHIQLFPTLMLVFFVFQDGEPLPQLDVAQGRFIRHYCDVYLGMSPIQNGSSYLMYWHASVKVA